MTTASAIITRVRSRLDETAAKFWTDADLIGWLNEALRDCGRYTRHITDTALVNLTGGVSEYTLPANIIEVENAYYLPGDGRQIPMVGMSYDNMNNAWGSFNNNNQGEPQAYALWGVPPSLQIKLYPAPSSSLTGGLSLLVTRMPNSVVVVSDTVDWPPAWEDVLDDYMEMSALRKARDGRWQEAYTMYTAKRDNLNINGHYGNDPQTFVYDGYAGMMPRWLVDF